MHLNYLGPVPVFLHPEFPSGCTMGVTAPWWLMAWWLAACVFPSWVPLRVRGLGSCSGQWLYGHSILCLIKWQATFFLSTVLTPVWLPTRYTFPPSAWASKFTFSASSPTHSHPKPKLPSQSVQSGNRQSTVWETQRLLPPQRLK